MTIQYIVKSLIRTFAVLSIISIAKAEEPYPLSSSEFDSRDLFISEYGEAYNSDKYLELFNPTNDTLNLSDYQLWQYVNGDVWPESTFDLSGVLFPQETYVIVNDLAIDGILHLADTASSFCSFNGDDAIGLAKKDTVTGDFFLIDVIGDPGEDPGDAWMVANDSSATKNSTLVRIPSYCSPNTNWLSSSENEWYVLPINIWNGIGIHEGCEIEGCTDVEAINYNPNVVHDDGSCSYTYIPGLIYYGTDNFIEYHAGNLPIIISAPHGGHFAPDSIADCGNCISSKDSYTQELIRYLKESIHQQTGCYPHVVINKLHRSKLEPNHDDSELSNFSDFTLQLWNEYQNFIDSASQKIENDFGKGLFLDFHGHAHTLQKIELGYLLSSSELQLSDSQLDLSDMQNESSIKSLANSSDSLSFSQLLRGQYSFGGKLEAMGFPALPSAVSPHPIVDTPYFTGGYMTRRHGSNEGGNIDGIQLELYSEIRWNPTSRIVFADSMAVLSLEYLEQHYFEDFSLSFCNNQTEGCTDSTAINYNPTAIIDDGTCNFYQTIDMPQGWSLFSTYIVTDNMNVPTILAPIIDKVVLVKNYLGAVYLSQWDFNSIGDLVYGAGYQIKTSQATTLELTGDYNAPEEAQIILPLGWSMFGYLRTQAADCSAVLESISSEIVIVKNSTGTAYLPAWDFNGIGHLKPGEGYRIKMNSTQILEFNSNLENY